MPERRISEQATARIQALCRRVAVARRLDDDLRRELCGHMEDKLLAYLDGQEPITEADALLLVERHFGKPEDVAAGMQAVHTRAAIDSLARRLAAVFALSCVLALCSHLISVTLVAQVNWERRPGRLMSDQWRPGEWMSAVMWVVLPAISVAVLWGTLLAWRRRLTSGERVWFADWPWWAVAAVAVGAMAAEELGWMIRRWSEMQGIDHSRYFSTYSMVEQALTVLAALAWVWWCAAGTRRWSWSALAGAAGWVGGGVLRMILEPGRLWALDGGDQTVLQNLRWTVNNAGRLGTRTAALAAVALLTWLVVSIVRMRRQDSLTRPSLD